MNDEIPLKDILMSEATNFTVTGVFCCCFFFSFYLSVRKEAQTKLVDGTGRRPHYSLRTLCRALRFAASNPCNSIQRSLYEVTVFGFVSKWVFTT